MALFLNQKIDSKVFTLNTFSDHSTFARLDYKQGDPYSARWDGYEVHYVSFNPKIPITEVQGAFFCADDSPTHKWNKGEVVAKYQNLDKTLQIHFSSTHPMVNRHFYESDKLEDLILEFANFVYQFNSIDDVKTICNTKHATEYPDALALSSEMSTLCEILNRMPKNSVGASRIIRWLGDAFLRFEILLKFTTNSGDYTQFSTLAPILAKHGCALFNK